MTSNLCIVVLFLIANSVELGSAAVCSTVLNKDGEVAACEFPFVHVGQTYNSCTNITDDNGRFWCSTKVDEKRNHLKGNWGYCDPAGNVTRTDKLRKINFSNPHIY